MSSLTTMHAGLAARQPFIRRDRLEGAIAFVEEGGRFFIHLADEAPLLAGLVPKMDEQLKPYAATAGPFSVLIAGTVVASRYSDGSWYRAQVVVSDLTEQAATLFYIDFGNVEVQPFDCVRALPREVYAVPPFAVACSLSGARRLVAWTADDAALFRKMLVDDAAGAPLTFVVIETGAVNEVEIYDKNRDNVGDRFLKAVEWRRNSACGGRQMLPAAAAAASDVHLAALPSSSVLATLLPRHSRNTTTALASAVESASLRFTAIAAETLTERRHNVVVSFVVSPSDLWLRLSADDSTTDAEHRLRLLEQCLQDYVARSAPPAVPFRWQRRQPCAARFALDGRWHRATLLDAPTAGRPVKVCAPLIGRERTMCQVAYVDYGNEEAVSVNELRPLPDEFITFSPALAIPCQLVGVKPPGGYQWPVAAANFLDTKLEAVQFSADFLNCIDGGRFQVELAETTVLSTQRPQSLSQQLIERGLAVADQQESSSIVASPPTVARSLSVATYPLERPHDLVDAPEREAVSLPPLKLAVGEELGKVAFILADGPLNMWIQASIYEKELLMVDAACQRVKGKPDEEARPLAAGDVCLAYFAEDGDWYRAEVVADGDSEGVAVHFVDFGNDAVCEEPELRRLPDDAVVRDTPPLGIHCKVVERVEPVGAWSAADNEMFQGLVEGAVGTVLGVDEGDGLVIVSLKRDGGVSVAETLLKKGLVKPEQSGGRRCAVEAVVSASGSVLKVTGLPELTIPAGLGDFLDVVVCNVHSAGRVFVHLRTDSNVLPELHNMIEAHFDGPFSDYKLVNPRRGDLCAFKYAAGSKFGVSWCRAMVAGRSSPKVVQLYLVDIGDNVEAAVDEVFELGAEVLAVPPQAIRLSIPDVAATCTADELRDRLMCKSAVVQLQKSLLTGDGFVATISLDGSQAPYNRPKGSFEGGVNGD